MNLLFLLGDDGTDMYGIIPPGPIQGVWVLPLVQFASLVRVR